MQEETDLNSISSVYMYTLRGSTDVMAVYTPMSNFLTKKGKKHAHTEWETREREIKKSQINREMRDTSREEKESSCTCCLSKVDHPQMPAENFPSGQGLLLVKRQRKKEPLIPIQWWHHLHSLLGEMIRTPRCLLLFWTQSISGWAWAWEERRGTELV